MTWVFDFFAELVGKEETTGYTSEVAEGDITTYAATDMKDYYIKMGEINELEGYAMEVVGGDGKNLIYEFYPEEESDISHFSVNGGIGGADVLVEYIYMFESEDLLFYDSVETTLNALTAYVYAYSGASDESPDGYMQCIGAYLDYNEGHAICLHVYIECDSEDRFIDEEDMVEFITPFADAFTVCPGE